MQTPSIIRIFLFLFFNVIIDEKTPLSQTKIYAFTRNYKFWLWIAISNMLSSGQSFEECDRNKSIIVAMQMGS